MRHAYGSGKASRRAEGDGIIYFQYPVGENLKSDIIQALKHIIGTNSGLHELERRTEGTNTVIGVYASTLACGVWDSLVNNRHTTQER